MITKIENGQYPYQYLCLQGDYNNLPTTAPVNSLCYVLDMDVMLYNSGNGWAAVGEDAPPSTSGSDDSGNGGSGK